MCYPSGNMKEWLRRCSLLAIVALVPATWWWVQRTEMTHLVWAIPGSGVVALGLVGLWYALWGHAPVRTRLRRCGLGLGLVLSLAGLASLVLRYEGSASGSSFPKFSWVWEAPAVPEGFPSLPELAREDIPGLRSEAGELSDFLGPRRDGMWEDLPFGTDWRAQPPELLWRRSLGKGWSSFSVSGGRALTQQQIGDDEHVSCFDLATGRELWSHADSDTRLLLERAENAGAAMGGDGPRATPVIHAERVYTMGSTGIVNCLDLESGRLLWSRHLLRELGAETQRWGMANSPLILAEEGLVVFAGPDRGGPPLIACELSNGETRWVAEGDGASYSSPRRLVLAGRDQVVSVNRGDVSAVNPATGETLWRHPWPGHWPKVGQPIELPGDRLLVTASYGAGSLLLHVREAAEGKLSVTELWKSNQLKTKFSSAVVFAGRAYGLDEGRLACLDLATGRRLWKGEKYGFGQQLRFADWLLIQAESGEVVVGCLTAEGFEERGRIAALSSMTWNVPAVAGRLLLVRNDREASAWRLPPPPANLSTSPLP